MIDNKNKVVAYLAGVLMVLACTSATVPLFLKEATKPGNAAQYSVEQTKVLKKSPLAGKTIYFLGSSVTEGSAAMSESFVDFIQKRNNARCVKEAKSGTTLLDEGDQSYVKRLHNLDKQAKVDAFVCQLSTNDLRFNNPEKLGSISDTKDINDFNTATTIGAIEHIISYAKDSWNCPVFFVTNSNFNSPKYEALIDSLYQIKNKWGIEIIDLYHNKEMNSISKEKLDLYMMEDRIHPLRAGYKLWWTPVIEKQLYKVIGKK